jgi:hypothetical protein
VAVNINFNKALCILPSQEIAVSGEQTGPNYRGEILVRPPKKYYTYFDGEKED